VRNARPRELATDRESGLTATNDHHVDSVGHRTPESRLVIGMTHDPNTPYAWAKRLTADLGNARLLTLRGDGHDILSSLNPCILGQALLYLEDGTLPPVGATCQREPPFGS
jgi:hypothetical protein